METFLLLTYRKHKSRLGFQLRQVGEIDPDFNIKAIVRDRSRCYSLVRLSVSNLSSDPKFSERWNKAHNPLFEQVFFTLYRTKHFVEVHLVSILKHAPSVSTSTRLTIANQAQLFGITEILQWKQSGRESEADARFEKLLTRGNKLDSYKIGQAIDLHERLTQLLRLHQTYDTEFAKNRRETKTQLTLWTIALEKLNSQSTQSSPTSRQAAEAVHENNSLSLIKRVRDLFYGLIPFIQSSNSFHDSCSGMSARSARQHERGIGELRRERTKLISPSSTQAEKSAHCVYVGNPGQLENCLVLLSASYLFVYRKGPASVDMIPLERPTQMRTLNLTKTEKPAGHKYFAELSEGFLVNCFPTFEELEYAVVISVLDTKEKYPKISDYKFKGFEEHSLKELSFPHFEFCGGILHILWESADEDHWFVTTWHILEMQNCISVTHPVGNLQSQLKPESLSLLSQNGLCLLSLLWRSTETMDNGQDVKVLLYQLCKESPTTMQEIKIPCLRTEQLISETFPTFVESKGGLFLCWLLDGRKAVITKLMRLKDGLFKVKSFALKLPPGVRFAKRPKSERNELIAYKSLSKQKSPSTNLRQILLEIVLV